MAIGQEKLLLKPGEAAEALGLSRSVIYQMIARRELPGVVRVGRGMKLSAESLRGWVREQVEAEAAGADGR